MNILDSLERKIDELENPKDRILPKNQKKSDHLPHTLEELQQFMFQLGDIVSKNGGLKSENLLPIPKSKMEKILLLFIAQELTEKNPRYDWIFLGVVPSYADLALFISDTDAIKAKLLCDGKVSETQYKEAMSKEGVPEIMSKAYSESAERFVKVISYIYSVDEGRLRAQEILEELIKQGSINRDRLLEIKQIKKTNAQKEFDKLYKELTQ